MTIYSLDVLLFLFGTSLLFHVQFYLLLPDLHTDFSRGRSGGLVFPSLSEFSTVDCDPTVKGFGIVNKAEIDVFLELSCLFHDPADVGNLDTPNPASLDLCLLPPGKLFHRVPLQPSSFHLEVSSNVTYSEKLS